MSRDYSFYAALMDLTHILYQQMQYFSFALHIGKQAQKQDFIWSRFSYQQKNAGSYELLAIYIHRCI